MDILKNYILNGNDHIKKTAGKPLIGQSLLVEIVLRADRNENKVTFTYPTHFTPILCFGPAAVVI